MKTERWMKTIAMTVRTKKKRRTWKWNRSKSTKFSVRNANTSNSWTNVWHINISQPDSISRITGIDINWTYWPLLISKIYTFHPTTKSHVSYVLIITENKQDSFGKKCWLLVTFNYRSFYHITLLCPNINDDDIIEIFGTETLDTIYTGLKNKYYDRTGEFDTNLFKGIRFIADVSRVIK